MKENDEPTLARVIIRPIRNSFRGEGWEVVREYGSGLAHISEKTVDYPFASMELAALGLAAGSILQKGRVVTGKPWSGQRLLARELPGAHRTDTLA